ncbi:MAG: zinc-ribbon and DUF3426 domain-containing protein [Caldimonas sp.]
MSLATRCTSCSTVFRVVQDQLKVSEGWVRCGRCDAVFNALEGLFDLGRESPPDWEKTRVSPQELDDAELPLAAAPFPSAAGADAPAYADADADAIADDLHDVTGTPSTLDSLLADPVDAHLFGPRKRADSAPKPAGQIGARDRVEFSDARFDSDLFAENPSSSDDEHVESASTDVAGLETTTRPEFLRRADRRARWRSWPARSLLAAGSCVATLVLLLQFGHHYRDTLAAQWPALRPVLASWCAQAGCTLHAPRRLADVLLETSALTITPARDAFVLSVNLRNRGTVALAAPSIDLNLTDSNGRLVARRALSPRDFRASEVLQAGAEAALQLTLTTSPTTVAGYTVEIFYP